MHTRTCTCTCTCMIVAIMYLVKNSWCMFCYCTLLGCPCIFPCHTPPSASLLWTRLYGSPFSFPPFPIPHKHSHFPQSISLILAIKSVYDFKHSSVAGCRAVSAWSIPSGHRAHTVCHARDLHWLVSRCGRILLPAEAFWEPGHVPCPHR